MRVASDGSQPDEQKHEQKHGSGGSGDGGDLPESKGGGNHNFLVTSLVFLVTTTATEEHSAQTDISHSKGEIPTGDEGRATSVSQPDSREIQFFGDFSSGFSVEFNF